MSIQNPGKVARYAVYGLASMGIGSWAAGNSDGSPASIALAGGSLAFGAGSFKFAQSTAKHGAAALRADSHLAGKAAPMLLLGELMASTFGAGGMVDRLGR